MNAPPGRPPRLFSWWLALGILAAAGLALFFAIQLAAAYKLFREIHPYLGYAFGGLVTLFGGYTAYLASRLGWNLYQAQRRKRLGAEKARLRPSQMTSDAITEEIAALVAKSRDVANDPKLAEEMRKELEAAAAALTAKLQSKTLEIVAFGTVSSGKSSLLNCLANREVFNVDVKGGTTVTRNEVAFPGESRVLLVDTPGLGEVQDEIHAEIARRSARDADLVLFVVDGPLKDFEYRLLAPLAELEKRLVVCLNKQDWFSPPDLQLLLGQIREQVTRVIPQAEVVAVRSRATQRTRIRVLPNGQEVAEQVDMPADLGPLCERLLQIVRRDGQELLLANLLLRSRGLMADARNQYQAALDKNAWEIIDAYTWQAGAAAALSPIPVLDVAAAAALDVKMVLDLARVYRSPIDLDTAHKMVEQLAKNLLTALGMSAAGPALGTAIASMLKSTVPGLGSITGGALQGLVQALMTRWIGSVFREYFRNGMQEPADGWLSVAKKKWEELTQPAALVSFARAGLSKLAGARGGRTD